MPEGRCGGADADAGSGGRIEEGIGGGIGSWKVAGKGDGTALDTIASVKGGELARAGLPLFLS